MRLLYSNTQRYYRSGNSTQSLYLHLKPLRLTGCEDAAIQPRYIQVIIGNRNALSNSIERRLTMDLSAELRYYEIRFTKIINQFFRVYKLDKLLTFIEMVCFVSGADASQVKSALQKVLGNDPRVRISREEYLVCLKLF